MLRASSGVSRALAVLLLLAPGSTVALLSALVTGQAAFALVGLAWGLAYLIVAVMAVVDAVRIFGRRDAAALGASTRLVKYSGIPFFITNFAVLATATGVTVLASSMFAAGAITGLLAAAAVPIMVVGTYLVMLPTSAWGVACAILLRRQGRAGTAYAVVHALLHLVFVVDIFSTLAVAYRARPGPPKRARMVGWIAGVVVMALLVPTVLFVADTPGRLERDRVAQQNADAMSALPGVARVRGMIVELAPGVTLERARAIAAQGYASQDNTSPASSSRWTLSYGRAEHVLNGSSADDAPVQALVLLGTAPLGDQLTVSIQAGRTVGSADTFAFTTVEGILPGDGREFLTAASTMIEILAAADAQAGATVNSISAGNYHLVGSRLRSRTTVSELDAVGSLLSDQVALGELLLRPDASKVTLTVPDESQITATCQVGLTALADIAELELVVHTRDTRSRDAEQC